MTRDEAKEILRNWDNAVWREQNHITMGDVSDALQIAEEALDFRKAMDSYIDTETSKQLSEEMTRGIVKQINPLFEKCFANVNPDTRAEVRRNMDYADWTEKACEWMDYRLEYFAEDTGKFDYESFFKAFREAMGAVVKDSLTTVETATNCNGLTWQDIARIADIMGHTPKLTKEGRVRKQEEYYKEVLEKFNGKESR